MTGKLTSIEKDEHDAVISNLAEVLKKRGLNVLTNPSESKNNSAKIKGKELFPDVFTYKEGSKKNILTSVYEVETESSVSEESAEQWASYSSDNFKFFLAVPEKSLEKARSIAKAKGIKVDGFWTF